MSIGRPVLPARASAPLNPVDAHNVPMEDEREILTKGIDSVGSQVATRCNN